jgi:hypothetical protein
MRRRATRRERPRQVVPTQAACSGISSDCLDRQLAHGLQTVDSEDEPHRRETMKKLSVKKTTVKQLATSDLQIKAGAIKLTMLCALEK